MGVSRETPDVATKPKCYDLINILVRSAVPLAYPDAASVCRPQGTRRRRAANDDALPGWPGRMGVQGCIRECMGTHGSFPIKRISNWACFIWVQF